TGIVVPILFPAATDSRFLRGKGIISYGFSPLHSTVSPEVYLNTAHGIDERIPVDGLRFGLDVMWDMVVKLAT
ncbi:MAG TPA: hypothetical protein PLQ76_09790, partial [bacterium]|nr:hypothetical protein [bacterium]